MEELLKILNNKIIEDQYFRDQLDKHIEQEKQLRDKFVEMLSSDGYEFFIASSSCKPGGRRDHSNILLTDFDDAVEFAQNFDAYSVLCYTWEMFIYHYRLNHKREAVLEKTIDLNDYCEFKNKNGEILSSKELIYLLSDETIHGVTYWKENTHKKLEENYTVIYKEIPEIVLKNKLPPHIGVNVILPTMNKASKFFNACGYHWEDSSSMHDYNNNRFYENPDLYVYKESIEEEIPTKLSDIDLPIIHNIPGLPTLHNIPGLPTIHNK